MFTLRHSSATLWTFGITCVLCGSAWTGAAEREAPPVASDNTRLLVHEALQREVYGLGDDRQKLLMAASEAEPQAQLPRWYLGQVQAPDGSWARTGSPPSTRESQLYRAYAGFRATKPNDATAHKALADWCASQGMAQQERAHLLRSLAFDPNQTELRKRLGQVKVGQQWFEPNDLARIRERQQAIKEATARWRPVFQRLTKQLSSQNASKRKEAADEILSVKDLFALPVLQATIGSHSDEAQELVIRAVDRFPDALATELLAWQSVELPSMWLRNMAAEKLARREVSDYAPLMIAEMYTPVVAKVEVVASGIGNVGLRRSFLREAMDHHELLVADTEIRTAAVIVSRRKPPLLVGSEARALQAAQTVIANTEHAVERQNQLTLDRNGRISAALTIATGATVQPQPEAWWQWWMDLNEWTLLGGKGVATIYNVNAVDGSLNPRKLSPRIPVVRVSCLAAGTPITTDQGLIAVEKLKAGDLVLARDIESGELAYKPILHTTVRPKKQLLRITAGKDVFEATGGHLFWVSGQGWKRARELEPGHVLHAAGAPVTVVKVEDGNAAETYNLVVADFANYFVGQGQFLSHDNTPRQPTRMIVPGLLEE